MGLFGKTPERNPKDMVRKLRQSFVQENNTNSVHFR